MKKINVDSAFIGILSLVTGVILTFCPKFISVLFYIAGTALIIYDIFLMATGISKGKSSIYVPKGTIGIVIGIVMIIMPRFMSVGVPIIVGIFFLLWGLNSFFTSLEKQRENRAMLASEIVSSVLMVVCGLFFITNAAKVSAFFVKLAGIVFIIVGVVILAIVCLRRKVPENNNDIIDIDDYSIKDDK